MERERKVGREKEREGRREREGERERKTQNTANPPTAESCRETGPCLLAVITPLF